MADFLEGSHARVLKVPLLTITDRAPGLINAIEAILHGSLYQPCLIHQVRNVLDKVPNGHQAQIKNAP